MLIENLPCGGLGRGAFFFAKNFSGNVRGVVFRFPGAVCYDGGTTSAKCDICTAMRAHSGAGRRGCGRVYVIDCGKEGPWREAFG